MCRVCGVHYAVYALLQFVGQGRVNNITVRWPRNTAAARKLQACNTSYNFYNRENNRYYIII